MTFFIVLNLFIFVGLSFILWRLPGALFSLAKKVLTGLILGALFGAYLNLVWRMNHPVLTETLAWLNIVGEGYIRLLQLIVIPLVLISILAAVVKLAKNTASVGKISFLILGILLLTTAIAALIGIVVTNAFHLTAEGLVAGSAELTRLDALQTEKLGQVAELSAPKFLLSFIPSNIFSTLTGAAPTSVISVVLIGVLLGLAALNLAAKNEAAGAKVLRAIDILEAWILELVNLIIRLTPYGVMALITAVVAAANGKSLINLGMFALASYVAFLLMFAVHGLLLFSAGMNPWRFFKKIMPVLVFAFTSRSSAASIPLNIATQTERLGVPESIAGFAASFGATIGQNGCAGIYPAMLAVMTAPLVGINPLDLHWLLQLIAVVTLSSIGVAGVGGGAVFASLIVLPTMGLPITLIALLISIEPLIDMGRTALNVSGAMTAGALTSKLLRQLNGSIFKQD